jgi:protocatechuate 3,4-dioxygenase beta subunit
MKLYYGLHLWPPARSSSVSKAIRSAGRLLLAWVALANAAFTQEPTIGVPPTIPLKGTVVDDDGKPVAGASVLVAAFAGVLNTPAPVTRTLDDGTFQIERPPFRASIQVRGRDGQSGGYAVLEPEQAEVNVQISPVVQGRGRLVDQAGNAVANTTISYTIPDKGQPGLRNYPGWTGAARTDLNGNFILNRLLAGESYVLKVTALPQVSRKALDIELVTIKIKPVKGEILEIGETKLPEVTDDGETVAQRDLRLRTLRLKGNVLDSAGKPVGDVLVEAAFLRSPSKDAPSSTKARSMEDGSFVIKRPVAGAMLSVRTKDNQEGSLAVIDDKIEEITLRLVPLAEVRGQLVDSLGQPVAGAKVMCSVVRPAEHGYSAAALFVSAITEADGSYRLPGILPNEAFTANVVSADNRAVRLATIKVDRAGDVDLGKTPLPRLAIVDTPKHRQAAKANQAPPKDNVRAGAERNPEPAIQLFLAEKEPGEGLVRMTLEGSDKDYFLHPQAIATSFDILNGVRKPIAPEQPEIQLQFIADEGQKIRTATARHVGKPLAIVIHRKLVCVPKVTSKFGKTTIISGLTESEADYVSSVLLADGGQQAAVIRQRQLNALQAAEAAKGEQDGVLRKERFMRVAEGDPRFAFRTSEPNWELGPPQLNVNAPEEKLETTPIEIYGRATDPQGNSIAGAKIYVASQGPAYRQLGETKSDADGYYRLTDVQLPIARTRANRTVMFGGFAVFGQARGFGFVWKPIKWFYPADGPRVANQEVQEPQFFDYSTPIVLNLNFQPAMKLRGRIVDDAGRPIAGTTIDIHYADPIPEFGYGARRAFDAMNLGDQFASLADPDVVPDMLKRRKTDADGRFVFDSLPPNCRFELDIDPPGCAARRIWAATKNGLNDELAKPVHTDGMEISFARSFEIPIQVLLGDTDKPGAGVMISGGNRDSTDWTSTNDQGRAKLELPAGKFAFRLLPASGTPYLITTERDVTIGSQSTEMPMIFRLRPATIVEISVEDADTGERLPNVDYWVADPWNLQNRIDHHFRSWDATTKTSRINRPVTDENGRLQTLFEPGEYHVGAGRNSLPTGYRTVDAQGKKIECKPGETVQLIFKLRKAIPAAVR